MFNTESYIEIDEKQCGIKSKFRTTGTIGIKFLFDEQIALLVATTTVIRDAGTISLILLFSED